MAARPLVLLLLLRGDIVPPASPRTQAVRGVRRRGSKNEERKFDSSSGTLDWTACRQQRQHSKGKCLHWVC